MLADHWVGVNFRQLRRLTLRGDGSQPLVVHASIRVATADLRGSVTKYGHLRSLRGVRWILRNSIDSSERYLNPRVHGKGFGVKVDSRAIRTHVTCVTRYAECLSFPVRRVTTNLVSVPREINSWPPKSEYAISRDRGPRRGVDESRLVRALSSGRLTLVTDRVKRSFTEMVVTGNGYEDIWVFAHLAKWFGIHNPESIAEILISWIAERHTVVSGFDTVSGNAKALGVDYPGRVISPTEIPVGRLIDFQRQDRIASKTANDSIRQRSRKS